MKKKEIEELLRNLSVELRAEIEASQLSLREARSITTKIHNLLDKANGFIEQLESYRNSTENKLNESSSKFDTIDASVKSASDSLAIIDKYVSEIREKISTMETFYSEFNATRERIEDPNVGLEAVLTVTKRYKAQVQSASTQASNLEEKIRLKLASVQDNIDKMVTGYAEFEEVKARIDDTETGLLAILDNSQSLRDDLTALSKDGQTLYAEITRYKDQAAKNAGSIQAIKDESDSTLEQIKQHEIDSQETKDRISRIFELVSQSGHANYFDTRRKKLIYASWGWLIVGIGAVIIAIIMAINLLLPLFPNPADATGLSIQEAEIGMLILRASIITPVIAFTIYAFRQYGKERKLAEQYAFKSVSASTIEGSIALIERSLKSVPSEHLNTQLADFAIKTAHSLHAEPQELQKLSRFSFNFGNKLAGIGAEMSDTLESINKEVKEMSASAAKKSNPE